ncbi:MAG: molybdenum cofactor guanylyltransferase [Gorillibacterium sp.]|nr:molybdenum cofactor guanylyltransferase [Gorillibacterium sp.]
MLTGVILAGYHDRKTSTSAKALLPFCGEMLVQRQVRMLKSICSEVIIVTNEPKTYLPILGSSVRIITDYFSGKGQLAGMHAAMSLSTSDHLWLVNGDMPFISAKAAKYMNEELTPDVDAVVPQFDGQLYPLHGVYHKSCVQAVSSALEKGEHDLSELTGSLKIKVQDEAFFRKYGLETHFVTNINTTNEYHHAMQLNYSLQYQSGAIHCI